MSFLIDTMYQKLGLTADEQATVNAALPSIKDALDLIDANLPSVNTLLQLVVTNKKPLTQLVSDWAVIGPNISSSCVDGSVDLFGTLGAVNDAKAIVAANPKNVKAATDLYNKLIPVANQLVADWPKIAPAVSVIMDASQRGNVTLGEVTKALSGYP